MAGDPRGGSAERFAEVELRRRRTWLLALAVSFPVINEVVQLWHLSGPHHHLSTFVGIGLALFTLPLTVAYRRWPTRQRGELTIDGRTLALDGETVMQRRNVKRALAFLDGDEHVVRVSSRSVAVCDVRVKTATEAERLLVALGQSESQVTATFACAFGRSLRPLAIFLSGVAAIVFGAASTLLLVRHGFHHQTAPLVMLAPSILLLAWLLLRLCKVTVGADGVAVQRLLRRRRFVPFSEVTDVRLEKNNVKLSLTGGRAPIELACATGNRRMHGVDADAQALTLHRRIEDARQHASEHRRQPARLLLARGSSTKEEWRRRVERLAEEAGSYRASALPLEELWNVLVDPQESAEVRAAAALGVRHQLDDAGRARVRVAASTIADAPLRRIFTAVDAGDEAELEEALETLPPARTRRAERT